MIRIEHGRFTTIVLSSFGGFGRESSQFLSKLVEKVAEKRGIDKGGVANYIRTKVAYELVRSQVACIRGSQSLWKKPVINTGRGVLAGKYRPGKVISRGGNIMKGGTLIKYIFAEGFIDQEIGIFQLWIENIFQ